MNLDELEQLPPYELTWRGKEYTYDPLVLGFKLDTIEGLNDVAQVATKVAEIFEIPPLTAYQQ